jgi:hypothetical protein
MEWLREFISTINMGYQGALILLGFFIHTISCILIIIAISYCPRWFKFGWASLAAATILVFIRRAGWAYSMIQFGSHRNFFAWEYMIYCVISIAWGIVGLEMIRKGRLHD